MRSALLLSTFTLAAIFAACSTDPVIQEQMVISPRTLVFSPPDTAKTVSITHTCTCPFSWWSSVTPTAPWLAVPANMTNDHTDVPFHIDRSKLTQDTSRAYVIVTANAYGTDSVLVTAIR